MQNSLQCDVVVCFCPTFAHHSTATKILFIHLTPCPLTKIMHVAVEICRQLIKTYNILGGGGGEENPLTFGTEVLIMCLSGVAKIFSGLKFRGPKGAISKL